MSQPREITELPPSYRAWFAEQYGEEQLTPELEAELLALLNGMVQTVSKRLREMLTGPLMRGGTIPAPAAVAFGGHAGGESILPDRKRQRIAEGLDQPRMNRHGYSD